ncbi:hypothetical protein BGZ54_010434 [Gamsiella multidivaricata]|nr:hypothetical protein BGZ54_010434 [Gamsiella multidivaricata]
MAVAHTIKGLRYEKNYKVVTNTATTTNKEYVLTQCGTPAPNLSLFGNTTVFIQVPVKNAASIAATAVYDLEHKFIVVIEGKNQTLRASQFQEVDVVFSTLGSESGTVNKAIITSEVSDPGPFKRAEWLEFYSTFFNLEEPAQNLTATINNNYTCFKSAASAKSTKPIIAWTSYVAPSAYNNNTASWTISGAACKQILSTDAGATFCNDTTVSAFSNNVDFLAAFKDVDINIDEFMAACYDMATFLQNYRLTSNDDYGFLKDQAVLCEDGIVNSNDGRDWFSGAVVMNNAVLQDIVRAVHPDALPADVHHSWIRNAAKNETRRTMTSADCAGTDLNKPIPDRALVCSTMKIGGGGNGGNVGTSIVVGALTTVLALFATAMAI